MPYDIRLGPLAFTWPTDTVEETVGESLEAVGAALTPSERRPRPLKLALRIEGATDEADAYLAGQRLRRQARQLLENRDWLAQGLYLWWRADPELAGWVRLAGGTIRETDPGVSFAIWDLELEATYLVGRPTTHRIGRRLDLADRRGGVVPRDTRGTIYSTDFAAQALPANPLIVPGDIVSATKSSFLGTIGNSHAGRLAWRTLPAVDGEVVAYVPDPLKFPDPLTAPLTLDQPGDVRVWDLASTAPQPPNDGAYTTVGDEDPTIYGWERVLGASVRSPNAALVIENGAIRVIWSASANKLIFEWWDTTITKFRRQGTIAAADASEPSEAAVVELTPERAVVEWRVGPIALRAILQRGWHHIRVESYNDTPAATARLEHAFAGTRTVSATPWVSTFTSGGRVIYWAEGTDADTWAAATFGDTLGAVTRPRSIVAQIASHNSSIADVAAWSLVDAQSVPVLLPRA